MEKIINIISNLLINLNNLVMFFQNNNDSTSKNNNENINNENINNENINNKTKQALSPSSNPRKAEYMKASGRF
tara:strand:- start:4 stop:225 length:222 start_codon:yes stop_codon:yes gene_type:complete